jgi:RNA polymerase sigma factor (sigma-70 family)
MWREVIAQLRAFVRRRIADPDRAEDLVGDIVLRIHQNLGSVDDQERLAHWVSRVARNAVIDEYRRAARAREQLLDTPADTAAVATMGPDPDDASSVLDELSRCLRPLLAGLPCRAASRRGNDRPRRDAAGRRRTPGERVVVGDEVSCAARAPAPGRVARPVLHVDPGRTRGAHGLRARARLHGGLRLQLSRGSAVTGMS